MGVKRKTGFRNLASSLMVSASFLMAADPMAAGAQALENAQGDASHHSQSTRAQTAKAANDSAPATVKACTDVFGRLKVSEEMMQKARDYWKGMPEAKDDQFLRGWALERFSQDIYGKNSIGLPDFSWSPFAGRTIIIGVQGEDGLGQKGQDSVACRLPEANFANPLNVDLASIRGDLAEYSNKMAPQDFLDQKVPQLADQLHLFLAEHRDDILKTATINQLDSIANALSGAPTMAAVGAAITDLGNVMHLLEEDYITPADRLLAKAQKEIRTIFGSKSFEQMEMRGAQNDALQALKTFLSEQQEWARENNDTGLQQKLKALADKVQQYTNLADQLRVVEPTLLQDMYERLFDATDIRKDQNARHRHHEEDFQNSAAQERSRAVFGTKMDGMIKKAQELLKKQDMIDKLKALIDQQQQQIDKTQLSQEQLQKQIDQARDQISKFGEDLQKRADDVKDQLQKDAKDQKDQTAQQQKTDLKALQDALKNMSIDLGQQIDQQQQTEDQAKQDIHKQLEDMNKKAPGDKAQSDKAPSDSMQQPETSPQPSDKAQQSPEPQSGAQQNSDEQKPSDKTPQRQQSQTQENKQQSSEPQQNSDEQKQSPDTQQKNSGQPPSEPQNTPENKTPTMPQDGQQPDAQQQDGKQQNAQPQDGNQQDGKQQDTPAKTPEQQAREQALKKALEDALKQRQDNSKRLDQLERDVNKMQEKLDDPQHKMTEDQAKAMMQQMQKAMQELQDIKDGNKKPQNGQQQDGKQQNQKGSPEQNGQKSQDGKQQDGQQQSGQKQQQQQQGQQGQQSQQSQQNKGPQQKSEQQKSEQQKAMEKAIKELQKKLDELAKKQKDSAQQQQQNQKELSDLDKLRQQLAQELQKLKKQNLTPEDLKKSVQQMSDAKKKLDEMEFKQNPPNMAAVQSGLKDFTWEIQRLADKIDFNAARGIRDTSAELEKRQNAEGKPTVKPNEAPAAVPFSPSDGGDAPSANDNGRAAVAPPPTDLELRELRRDYMNRQDRVDQIVIDELDVAQREFFARIWTKEPLTEQEGWDWLKRFSAIKKKLEDEQEKQKQKQGAQQKPQQQGGGGQQKPQKPDHRSLIEKMLDQMRKQQQQNQQQQNQQQQMQQMQQMMQQMMKGLSQQQQQMMQQLMQMMQGNPQMNKAMQEMMKALQQMQNGTPGSSIPNQNQAMQEMMKALQQMMGQGPGGPGMGSGAFGPQGTTTGTPSAKDNPGKSKIDPNELGNDSRAIRDELRKRLDDPNLSPDTRRYYEDILSGKAVKGPAANDSSAAQPPQQSAKPPVPAR